MQKPLRKPLRARSKRGGYCTGCLLRLRPSRRRLAPLLALLCYVFVGAIVPQGHMAAALAGGTAFHWCPGDLRSAQIIDALTAFAAHAHRHRHHHHHAGGHALDAAAAHGAALDKSSADPGCSGAGSGAAASNAAVVDTAFDGNDSTPRAAPGASAPRRLRWRSRARSPPV